MGTVSVISKEKPLTQTANVVLLGTVNVIDHGADRIQESGVGKSFTPIRITSSSQDGGTEVKVGCQKIFS